MTVGIVAVAVLISMGLAMSQGIKWYIYVPVGGIMFVVVTIITLWELKKNKDSFAEAERLRQGQHFKSDAQEARYQRYCERHPLKAPKKNMQSDMALRYRSPALVFELLGALLLVLILIILFEEEKRDPDSAGVKYIVIGVIVVLLYFAASNIFGFKSKRFYLKLTDDPEFDRIERSYMNSTLLGTAQNYISIGEEFITLLVPNAVIPIKRSEIAVVRRADVIGGTNYNGKLLSGEAELFFLNFYVDRAVPGSTDTRAVLCKVRLTRFDMQRAFELLRDSGVNTEEQIDLK